jgi:hypothetical protein
MASSFFLRASRMLNASACPLVGTYRTRFPIVGSGPQEGISRRRIRDERIAVRALIRLRRWR